MDYQDDQYRKLQCCSTKYLYPPHGRSKGEGVLETIFFFKESLKPNWNYQRGGGEGWIFSGTAQYPNMPDTYTYHTKTYKKC